MNDSIIINTISKIHFTLISILSFIFILLFGAFILLQNGLYIDDIALQNIKIKKLYIKWDEKITLSANEITISTDKKSNDLGVQYKEIVASIKEILPFTNWLKELELKKITINGIEGEVKYSDDQEGYLNLKSDAFTLKSSLLSNSGMLHIAIEELKAFQGALTMNGNLLLRAKREPDFIAFFDIRLHDETNVALYLRGDTQKLLYELVSKEPLRNTKKIVALFDLEPNIKYWVDDAIDMATLSLHSFSGWFEYQNFDKAHLNLYAKATANNLNYTYDQKLASIGSMQTELEFKNGILYIRPKEAYSYGFNLDKSWLKIDFAQDAEILTLHLLFSAQVNQDILSLLERYRIKLPFIQNRGSVATDLKLDVNLRTLDVAADGSFYAKDTQINYLGLDIDVPHADVYLNNSHVKVQNMYAKYRDIASAKVYMDLDAKESKGKLTLKFDKIAHKENSLALANKQELVAIYNIQPTEDFISIDKSTWNYKEKMINVSAVKIPFHMETLKAHLPVTSILAPEFGLALLSGDILLKEGRADLNIDILKINKEDIELHTPAPSFKLLYNNGTINIDSKKEISIKIDKKQTTFQNVAFKITKESITAENIHLNYNDTMQTKVDIDYNFLDTKGAFHLKESVLYGNDFNEIFKVDEKIEFFLEENNSTTLISSKKYDFEFISTQDGWTIDLKALDKISQHSKLLKKYDLTTGTLKIEKKESERDINFLLQSDFKYKFLTTLTKPIESYTAKGRYNLETKEADFMVNESVHVAIKDKITIDAKNIGINLKEIIDYFAQRESTQELKDQSDLHIQTDNSFLYLAQDRRIISDRISLKYSNKTISAELLHNRGRAVFTLTDDKIYLYGDAFGDLFMDELFALSKFKGGSFEFFINGTLKEFDGMINIEDTTILEYKILNNILAFVNTIPSLVTFSLPGYSQNGVAAERTYMNFKYKDDVYKISDIYMKSKEIEIAGVGEASIEKNSIDLDLNLKTDLGSSVSQIPLVGYILLGKESISTTLKVTGKLDDPDVKTQIAKDIAVAPFNIIKRTFMFPFELFKGEEKKDEQR